MLYKFYKSDFTERAYARLIKLAKERGYEVTEFANFADVDTTAAEDDVMRRRNFEMSNSSARLEWADRMIKSLEEDARQRRYIAQPGTPGERPVVFHTRTVAADFCERKERETGLLWIVRESYEY